MVQLQIITKTSKIAEEITKELVINKLILEPFIIKNDSGSLITARTKSLLFKSINEKIIAMEFEKMPIIYSTPILNMDWDQSLVLQKELKQV